MKKATASTISRIIGKAGIKKSEESKTKIRGYHLFSEGYKVTESSSYIWINYVRGDKTSVSYVENRENAKTKIIETLTTKGYTVHETSGLLAVLKVSA
jgi:acyl-CoA synthetase (AMP-forming)/AMP-acid ligase II